MGNTRLILTCIARQLRYGLALVATVVLVLFLPARLQATNGMYMISHGARYGGMAGASTALGGSVMDLHSNPALLGLNGGSQWEAGLRINYAQNRYQDQFIDSDLEANYNNDITSYMIAPLPYLGWQAQLYEKLSVGAAFYLVGGGGGSFENITRLTPTATSLNDYLGYDMPIGGQQKQLKESLYARMMHARLSTGLAWKLQRLRVGIALAGAHGGMEMRQLMHDPGNNLELPGTGLRYKSDPAYGLSGQVGLSYDLNDTIRVGYNLSAPTRFHMDGVMRINTGNPAYYHNNQVSLEMDWPEQHRLGLLWHKSNWKWSIDLGYIQWSSYLNTLKFQLDQPAIRTPLGFDSSQMIMNLNTRDQVVLATGLEFTLDDGLALRCGYNYARANLSPEGVNPLFAIVTEHHITMGAGWDFDDWLLDLALEYAVPGKMESANISNWEIGHALIAPDDVRLHQFESSKSMQALAFMIGTTFHLDQK